MCNAEGEARTRYCEETREENPPIAQEWRPPLLPVRGNGLWESADLTGTGSGPTRRNGELPACSKEQGKGRESVALGLEG